MSDIDDGARLLAVSGDTEFINVLRSIENANHWKLEVASNVWEAIDRVHAGLTLDLLLLDLPPEDQDGMYTLRWLRRIRPTLTIILIDHSNDVGRRQQSVRMGAGEYLSRPINLLLLRDVIQRNLVEADEAVESGYEGSDVEFLGDEIYFVGISPLMKRLRAQVELLAQSDLPVLILGEEGSGKDTVARLLHRMSVRSGMDFIKVNCASLPERLLRRELFGEERRDSTGSARTRIGKMEMCANGTILLDKIADMPLRMQEEILKYLVCKEFIRPGTIQNIVIDTRIVAACSLEVVYTVSEKRIHEDLYRRLGIYTVYIPPLRERKMEIPVLAQHFMQRLAKRYNVAPREYSLAIIEAWKAYSWPGNLRELEDCVKRYLLVGDEEIDRVKNQLISNTGTTKNNVIGMRKQKRLPQQQDQCDADFARPRTHFSLLHSVKAKAERSAIIAALENTGWNRKAAAQLLNVSYRTVLYKIEEYQIIPASSMRQLSHKGDVLKC
jgi:two-component system, NtrC family, response regulator AtoC